MSLAKIYGTECLKAAKKPITAIFLIPLLLPLFYTISMITDASYMVIEGDFNLFSWLAIMWSMLQMLSLPHILFALYSAASFSYELEGGQLKNLLVRGCARKKLFYAKVLVQYSLLIGMYFLFYLISCICYFVMNQWFGVFPNSSIPIEWISTALLMDVIYLINIVMVINLVLYLGLHQKTLNSFLIGISLHLSILLLQFFPILRYFSPSYVASQLGSFVISSEIAGIMLTMYIVIAIIPVKLASRKFEQMDIV